MTSDKGYSDNPTEPAKGYRE